MTLHIALRGWDHPEWSGAFYPEDLPPEWRLVYFANHFEAVWLPEAVWRAFSGAQWAAWREQAGPRLRFYLEGEGPGVLEAGRRLGESFGGAIPAGAERVGGLAVGVWRGGNELRALRPVVETLISAGEGLLIIDGEPPSPEAARGARVLAQLLGAS